MARYQPVATQFAIAQQNSLRRVRELLIATAKREHAAVMRADPRPSAFKRWVDGVEGAPEERVKDRGVIHYEYSRIDEIVRFTMDTLFDKSPVRTGRYRKSHTIFVDGVASSL